LRWSGKARNAKRCEFQPLPGQVQA